MPFGGGGAGLASLPGGDCAVAGISGGFGALLAAGSVFTEPVMSG